METGEEMNEAAVQEGWAVLRVVVALHTYNLFLLLEQRDLHYNSINSISR